MSDTKRNIGHSYYRKPKGHKQAKISRARSVPPNSWDDIKFSSAGEFYQPLKRFMDKQIGKKWNKTRSHISEKWGVHAASIIDKWLDRNRKGFWWVDDQGILRKN